MTDLPAMTDEQLLQEYETTAIAASSLVPGVEPPTYSTEQLQRHEAAEAELRRRGFTEATPGFWERPRP